MRLWMIWMSCLFYMVVPLSAQSGAKEEPLLTIHLEKVSLREILSVMEEQSGYFFSYESSLIESYQQHSLTLRQVPFSEGLKRLFDTLPLTYQQIGRSIILRSHIRTYTIAGFIRDKMSGESLIASSVMDRLSSRGVVTNNSGFYSLTLPVGKVRLQASYVGYAPLECTFDLHKDTLIDLSLKPWGQLKEVVVEGNDPRSDLNHAELGMITLTPKEVKQVPTLLGEPDLVKTLQQTPGVAIGTETMAALYVRGGDLDENLVWMDGVPLYQVGHLGGIFSAFNPEAVKLAGFYKGSFPTRFGERLSSVVDVRSRDGDLYNYHGNASLGLIAGNVNLSGPIVKGRTSFHVACRRSWMDAILSPALAITRWVGQGAFDTYFRYAFQDVNAKINHKLSETGRLEAGLYYGDDLMKLREKSIEPNTAAYRNYQWRWGNLTSFLNWNQLFGQKLFGNLTLFYSRYRSRVHNRHENSYERLSSRLQRSRIDDIGCRFLLDYTFHSAHLLKSGAEYVFHSYQPRQEILNGLLQQQMHRYGQELALFVEDDWQLTKRLQLHGGVRFSYYNTLHKGYVSVRPRLSLRYRCLPHLSLKASYAETNQYVQMLSDTYASLPSDIWMPVTQKIRPMSARIGSVGLYSDKLQGYTCSVEGYYKQMNRVLEYKDYRNLLMLLAPLDEQVTEGSRRSYGVEMMVRKNSGKLTGWVGYTLSWTDCFFPELNRGKRFPFRFDNRHKLNVVAAYRLNPKVELTAAWTVASGNHLTVATEMYKIPLEPLLYNDYYPAAGSYNRYNTYTKAYTDRRNNEQLPTYHRLDLGMTLRRPLKHGRMGIWSFGLYNAYCRMNPITLRPIYEGDDPSKMELKMKSYSLLPVIPSASYTYKF